MFRAKKSDDNFARYVSMLESSSLAVEVSFNGGAENPGQENPEETSVSARCLRKANVYWPTSPWIESWDKDFGNLVMPGGAWNGIKLVEIIKDRIFLAISNNLLELDSRTGETIWVLETGNTPIYHILASERTSALIVFNGYYQFKEKENLGNISAVGVDGNLIWRTPLPSEEDIFSNPPHYQNGELKSGSWKGFTCTISEENGSITGREFTK